MHDVDRAVHYVDAMVSANSVSLDTSILSSLLTTPHLSLAHAVSPRPASHSPQASLTQPTGELEKHYTRQWPGTR